MQRFKSFRVGFTGRGADEVNVGRGSGRRKSDGRKAVCSHTKLVGRPYALILIW